MHDMLLLGSYLCKSVHMCVQCVYKLLHIGPCCQFTLFFSFLCREMHASYTNLNRDIAHAAVKQTRRRLTATYLVLITKAGATFGASLPDIPGCVATSTDLNRVKDLIKEGVWLHLTRLWELKKPLPNAKTISFEEDLEPEEQLIEVVVLRACW